MQAMRANIGKGIAAGMAGGLVAAWAMERFQSALPRVRQTIAEPQPSYIYTGARQPAQATEPATVKAAAAISSAVLHRSLRPDQKETAGEVVHYAVGAIAGGIYGVLAEYLPEARLGAGSAFGAALWAVSDEIGVPLSGLSRPPEDYPLRVHAAALAAHLVYGLSTELLRSALRRGVLAK